MYDIIVGDIKYTEMKHEIKTTLIQNIFRIILALFMIYAGFSHLTFNRVDFQAQVPDWIPMSKDVVVIISGIIEMLLGLGLLIFKNKRAEFGWAMALFFILVFPGNVSQYLDGEDAFGVLDSDGARLRRLFFQPILIAWAIWASGAWSQWRVQKQHVKK